MITDSRILIYALNFLKEEIEQVEELIKSNKTSEIVRYHLSQLLKQYKQDLKKLEDQFD